MHMSESESFKNLILFLYEKVISTISKQIIILTRIARIKNILGKKIVNAVNPPKIAPSIILYVLGLNLKQAQTHKSKKYVTIELRKISISA